MSYLIGMVLWSTHHSQIPQQQVSVLVTSDVGQNPLSDNGLSQQFSTAGLPRNVRFCSDDKLTSQIWVDVRRTRMMAQVAS